MPSVQGEAEDESEALFGEPVGRAKAQRVDKALDATNRPSGNKSGALPVPSRSGPQLEKQVDQPRVQHALNKKGGGVKKGRAPPPPPYMCFDIVA